MTIRDTIESAFADVPYPGDDRIADHQNCPECDDIRKHFRGTTWCNHPVEDLQQYQSALTLFTPAALHYFLPGYMHASLGAWRQADSIPFSILQMCLPSDPSEEQGLQQHRRERFEIFTPRQREAIAAYLLEWASSGSLVLGAEDIPRAVGRLLDHKSVAESGSVSP
jgi:hypothetical protein